MIYTDGIHLVADRLQELHGFAGIIGLKRCYFEGVKKRHPHYDLWTKAGNLVMCRPGVSARHIVMTSKHVVVVSNRVVFKKSQEMLSCRRKSLKQPSCK